MRKTEAPILQPFSLALVVTFAAAMGLFSPSWAQDPHAGHDHGTSEEEESDSIHLTGEQWQKFGIVTEQAGPGRLFTEVSLPGEIVFSEDKVVHLSPGVAGIARDVHKTLGDPVNAGELLAALDSRELAQAKSEFLASRARLNLAEKLFTREKKLRDTGVSSEQDFLQAEKDLAEAEIALVNAEQTLHALGFLEGGLPDLETAEHQHISRFEIHSPISGVVTEKHIVRGESLESDSHIFTIADTRLVWANLAVYAKNLSAVKPGHEIVLQVDHSGMQARARVEMVTPFVDEATRSATARVVLDNSDGRWLPGTFVTGYLSTSTSELPVVVAKKAVQRIDDQDVVFIQHEGGLEMTPVVLGPSDRTHVEIVAGLDPGTTYVTEGAFELKATVITQNLGSHAGHGH